MPDPNPRYNQLSSDYRSSTAARPRICHGRDQEHREEQKPAASGSEREPVASGVRQAKAKIAWKMAFKLINSFKRKTTVAVRKNSSGDYNRLVQQEEEDNEGK